VIVYGSELICVRFGPTGFSGIVGDEGGEEEDPEHPTSVTVHKASKHTNPVLWGKTSPIIPIVE
jgi:hypothetical protein